MPVFESEDEVYRYLGGIFARGTTASQLRHRILGVRGVDLDRSARSRTPAPGPKGRRSG